MKTRQTNEIEVHPITSILAALAIVVILFAILLFPHAAWAVFALSLVWAGVTTDKPKVRTDGGTIGQTKTLDRKG